MKECCTCRKWKTLDHYTKDRTTKDGLGKRCKECQLAYRQGKRTKDTRPPEERFWSCVDKSGACWIWKGGTTHKAGYPDRLYGIFHTNKERWGAHRYSYRLAYGACPESLFVCHRCDNPLCVRPDHLFLGTTYDNTADMVRKGRQSRGIAHRTQPRLTPQQVREIVKRYQPGIYGYRRLGADYDVTPATIKEIILGRSWSDVTGLTERPRLAYDSKSQKSRRLR